MLRTDLKVDLWNEKVFELGNSYLEDLLKAVDTYDFAVFVFAPDDLTTMRATRRASVRDNVLFELGLFMGRLGRHRAFWLVPRGKDQPKIPSDLEGIRRADFDSAPSKRPKSLKMACRKLKDQAGSRAGGRMKAATKLKSPGCFVRRARNGLRSDSTTTLPLSRRRSVSRW